MAEFSQRAAEVARRVHELAGRFGNDTLCQHVHEWIEEVRKRDAAAVEFESRRMEHFLRIEDDPAWRNYDRPPIDNVAWDAIWIASGLETKRAKGKRVVKCRDARLINGWVPSELRIQVAPAQDPALNPASGVPITRVGKYAVICAAHDATYFKCPIITVPYIRTDRKAAEPLLPYAYLVRGVRDWPTDRWDLADGYLADVATDLSKTCGQRFAGNDSPGAKRPGPKVTAEQEKFDSDVWAKWDSHMYRTYKELADAMKLGPLGARKIRRSLDRRRKKRSAPADVASKTPKHVFRPDSRLAR